MLNWSIEKRKLDLKYTWKISRNESTYKENFFIEVSDEKIKGQGEAAPNIRYQETHDLLEKQYLKFIRNASGINSPEELNEKLKNIPISNSLRFGIECAYLDYYLKKNRLNFYKYFNLNPPSKIFTSYTIPILLPSEIKKFIEDHGLKRFKSLKIKISTNDLDLIQEVAKHYQGPLRIDANEAWKDPDEHLKFLEKIKKLPIEFIEQPFPAASVDEYIYFKEKSFFPVIGDESITSNPDFNSLKKQFHGINMKLMKAGGILNGLEILKEAKKYQLKTMIGCMIETTMGISWGMRLCGLADYVDLDGFFVIKDDPFGLVKENDGELIFKK